MRFLLDTQVIIWAVDQPHLLSTTATSLIQDPANARFLSAASIWEIAIKYGKNRLPLSLPYRDWMNKVINDLSLILVRITVDYANQQAALPPHHGDPFDRLIVAQALVEGIPIISIDSQLDAYGITRLW